MLSLINDSEEEEKKARGREGPTVKAKGTRQPKALKEETSRVY